MLARIDGVKLQSLIMSYSYTTTNTATESFTLTHAKYLASKVTADMVRCQQNYGVPSDAQINSYGTELALMLRGSYVAVYEFGFQRDGQRLVSWHYVVTGGAINATDDRPGRIISGVNISDAQFFNFMTYSASWSKLTQAEREEIRKESPVLRPDGVPPRDGLGYWANDLAYSSTGVILNRRTFRPHTI
jgi:hypothetical protein